MSVRSEINRRGVSNDDILRYFREAHQELVEIIEGMPSGSRFSQFRRRQLASIQRVVLRLEKNSRSWAEVALPEIMEAAARETLEQIKEFKEKDFKVEFAGVNQEAVKILVETAWLDFGSTMTGLEKDAKRKAIEKRTLQERVLKGFIQGSSGSRTQAQIVKELKSQGFTVLKAKNGFGRRFTLEAYANMLVRTQNITAYSLGSKNQLLGSGRRYAIFPTLTPDIDGTDVCNEWEKKKYIDLLTDPLPPASTHPNCRHVPVPVSFAQLKAERPDLYEKAIRYYDETVG